MRLLFSVVFVALSVQISFAQLGYRHNVVPQISPDSVDLAYYGKKKFWQGSATIVDLNLGVWAFDRYIVEGDFVFARLPVYL